jgi:hypothetical protein
MEATPEEKVARKELGVTSEHRTEKSRLLVNRQ